MPVAPLPAGRGCTLYAVADSASAVPQSLAVSRTLGPVPVIDPPPRRTEALPFDPASTIRFRDRSAVEQVHATLTDTCGGRFVRVRGHAKVLAPLLVGLLALPATQLFTLLR